MINFLHTFHPQPLVFQWGPIALHWYGLLMVLGGLVGYSIVTKLAKRYAIEKKVLSDLLFWGAFGALLGARIYYVIYAWPLYADDFWQVFKIWEGGLAVHGVMLGLFVSTAIYCYVKKINFWLLADLIVVGLSAGQIIGRIGNYFNQEIFGTPTDLPWGIPIDFAHRPMKFVQFEYFHPTFLYEVVGSGVILSVLLLLHYGRLRRRGGEDIEDSKDSNDSENRRGGTGAIFLIYLCSYSILRFVLEFWRTDYTQTIFGLRWAMVVSGVILLVALILLLRRVFFLDKKSLTKRNNYSSLNRV